jgi:hypothetical protein
MPNFPDLLSFLNANASAVFGLLGALGGGVLSYFSTSLQKRRDFDLQLWGKLFDRRIGAHEEVIAMAVEMRIMVASGEVDAAGEVRRFPQVLQCKEKFEEWWTRFTLVWVASSTWLSTPTKREINFVQDYLVTLHMDLVKIDSALFPVVGEIIRQDFIDLSASLEKQAFEFFARDIRKLRLNNLQDWHKYPRPETERRFMNTALRSNIEKIQALNKCDA